jgi:hypothetical protein
VHLYLEELIGKRLISQDVTPDGIVYRTTENAREFLENFTPLMELLEEREQELEAVSSSPYIASRSWIR